MWLTLKLGKWTNWIITWSLLLVLLGACGTDGNTENATNNASQNKQTENETEEQEDTVLITISKDEGEETINEKEVAIEDGAILMEVMDENFELETEFEGEFIVSIEGIGPEEDEDVAWMYSVNDEMAEVGASEYVLEADDEVVFDLQGW